MNRRTPAISLIWKIFLGGVLVVVGVAALTLAMTARSAERAANVAVAHGLGAARAYVRTVFEGRERGLDASAQAFARHPSLRALFENPHTDRATFFDQARKAIDPIAASTVHIIDARGVRLARSDDSAAVPDTLARSPLFARALAGRRAAGVMIIDTLLHQAIAVPIEGASGRVVGVLMATKAVNDSVALEITDVTSTAVIFFALDSAGRPRISGTSLERNGALTRFLDERAPIWAAADPVSPSARDRAESDTVDAISRINVTLGESRWAASGAGLRSAGGTAVGGFVALRSVDAEMAAFIRLQRSIFLATLAGLLLALGLSHLMARSMSRRVSVLEAATRRASDGDYGADIPAYGRDEIGRLAESIRAMFLDLRERRDLVDFLSSNGAVPERAGGLSGGRPGEVAGNGLQPGQKLAGRYEIIAPIGSGVTGVVYRALDVELSEHVAIKTLRREFIADSTALARFRSELRIMRRISHRNVVRTHDVGEADGMYFLAMEYVEGTPVKALITARGRLPVHATLPIAKQLCHALEGAHAEGIIHRDIKPHNMVVAPDGVLKVMDFGIARLLGRTQNAQETGTVAGAPEYMAPEQLRGEDVDTRADIYAVGVVVYECLTGRTPHSADNLTTLTSAIPPHELVSDIPRKLSEGVLTALHRDRKRRPRTIAEFRDLLVN